MFLLLWKSSDNIVYILQPKVNFFGLQNCGYFSELCLIKVKKMGGRFRWSQKTQYIAYKISRNSKS